MLQPRPLIAETTAACARVTRAALASAGALALFAPAAAWGMGPSTTTPGASNNPSTAPARGVNTQAGGVNVSPSAARGQTTGASAPPASTTAAPAAGATGTTPTTTYVPSGSTQQRAGIPLFGTRAGAAAATHKKGGGRRISTGVAIIAALAALLALGAAAWALARHFAYEPSWWLGMRHSFAEASFRSSATWAELRDWARIGR